jgi:hypothetical protein
MTKLILISAILIFNLVSSSDTTTPLHAGYLNYENLSGTSSMLKEAEGKMSETISIDEAETEFELVIEIELTRFEGRALRPYVAVWVENEKAETIRTLALWFNDFRWLPDIRRWYTKNYEKIQQGDYIDAITGATRPAGKYTIRWDGKDDQGKMQKKGKYTVFIEVVRERGTYQLIRQEVELNSRHQRFELPAGTEVSSAIIEYRKTESPS